MKTFKRYIFIIISIFAITGFTSCQSEDEMEDIILQNYCWQGTIPIRSYNDYYSRFYFNYDGTGVEEVWKNGRYSGEYPFDWDWLNHDFAVLTLRYSRNDISCIDIEGGVTNRHIRGYFYKKIDDYYDYKYDNYDPDRSSRYIDLKSNNSHRYN